jgi:flagellar motor switch protein FliG
MVLASLDEHQVESISREIAGIRGITKEKAAEIFAEFQGLFSSYLSYGGAADGPEEAQRAISRLMEEGLLSRDLEIERMYGHCSRAITISSRSARDRWFS